MATQKIERFTSQKKIILDHLKNVTSHPSAESIHRAVKRKLPSISLGTVYRILDNLEKKGEILEIPHRIGRYDGNVTPHMHFLCEKCGEISDVFQDCDVVECQKLHNLGQINYYRIYLYGLCNKCK